MKLPKKYRQDWGKFQLDSRTTKEKQEDSDIFAVNQERGLMIEKIKKKHKWLP